MKHILPLLIMLTTLCASAEIRTDEEMQSIALQALSQSTSTRLKAQVASSTVPLLKDMPQLRLYGFEDAGWVIVSKDDAFEGVLGYSDEPINMSNPSPEFLWLMRTFSEGMAKDLREGGARARAAARRETCSVLKKTPILLSTNWDQGWPYNLKCPTVHKVDGGKEYDANVVCGCVATAFAQVFNYLKLPKKMSGKKSYTWANKEGVSAGTDTPHVLSYDFSANPFDWDNITDTYNEKSSKAQLDAIANLIYACGVMAEMDYNPGGSGSYCGTVTNSINTYCQDIRSYDSPYNPTNFITIVAKELNELRPIVFSGADENDQNGHCFVIDGADNKGYLHCNMGWSGGGNGYYAADAMNGYPTYQKLNTVEPFDNIVVVNPLDEIRAQKIYADNEHPVTDLKTDTWYVMWNEGRNVALRDAGKGKPVATTPVIPNGRRSEYTAGAIVRLSLNTKGDRYYIETGLGNYLPSFNHNQTGNAVATKSTTYSITPIEDGHFCIRNSNDVRMDCNGTNIVGWNTGMINETGGNASWQFYPVTFSPDDQAELVSDFTMNKDVLRMVVGDKFALKAVCEPATASLPFVNWSMKSNSYASINEYGEVTGLSKGSTVVTASTIDGSGISKECTVYVGSSTKRAKVTLLKNTGVYTLRNTGFTQGYLIATDTTTTYPQLRGIVQRQTLGCKDELYWDDAVIGNEYTQWQIMKDAEGLYYLYNVGMKKFLVNGEEEGTEYVFSSTPKSLTVTPVEAGDFTGSDEFSGCFYLNCGQEQQSRLIAGTAYLNPAHWLNSTTAATQKLSVWEICELSGVSTGLDLLTTDELALALDPEGIAHPTTGHIPSNLSYDLQGRRLQSIAGHGIMIKDRKIIIK